MLFTDDDSRHAFHTSATLLQVVCHMLEADMALHHIQLELVDVDHDTDRGVVSAFLVVNNEKFEDCSEMKAAFTAVVTEVNRKFPRSDGLPTAQVEEGNFGLVTVRVTEASDFAVLN